MWQALDYSVDILANALYCTCQICHFNSEKIEHRNGKKGTFKLIHELIRKAQDVNLMYVVHV